MHDGRADLSSHTFIQVFNRYQAPGGEEKSVARIAAHLESGGATVVRFWKESSDWQKPGAPSKWRQPFLLLHNPTVLEELRQLSLKARPTAWVLHNVVPIVSLGIYRLARQMNIPVIQWLHNYRPVSLGGALRLGQRSLSGDTPFLHLREIMAGAWRNRPSTALLALGYAVIRLRGDFAAVKAWIAISHEMAGHFTAAGYPRDRLFVLHHSWDIAPESEVVPGEGGHFLFMGRITREKGVEFLIRLWRDLGPEAPRLVIAGDGPERETLQTISPTSVHWAGHVEGTAKTDLIRRSRAVLVPSLWAEPLGLVTYEAYEQARPVLASDRGGLKETVIDRQTGRSLSMDQPAAWRAAVEELIKRPNTADAWGRNGRHWLEQNTSPEVWRSRFYGILREVLCRQTG